MILDIAIPTYLRAEKLMRALASIKASKEACPSDVKVNVDVFYSHSAEWLETSRVVGRDWIGHHLIENGEFRLPIFWNDRLRESKADALCFLNDDILLSKTCLTIAAKEIKKMEFDGVLGFRIENITETVQPCLTSFGVIGIRYADRFPNRKVFCPEYVSLYADVELQRQAEKLGRFRFVEQCSLVHYHPAYAPDEQDFTHLHTRRNFASDRAIFERRNKAGLLWGIT